MQKAENNRSERLTSDERGFVKLLDSLTEQRIVRWERKGNEMVGVLTCRLSVSDPAGEAWNVLAIDRATPGEEAETSYAIVQLPEELLVNQFVELQESASARTVAA
jgi:hypothetical protein